jgi:type VI secretion system protein ImpM
MPEAVLSPAGFFGKLPAAGDFVTRRLPPGFVRFWDPFASRHLVPRLAAGHALFFLLPGEPPVTGVALPSADRAGRRFPLTLAAVPPRGDAAPEAAAGWYAALAAAGQAAAAGAIDADALDARLRALPGPPLAVVPRLLLWSADRPPREADPEAPAPALDALLGAPAEAG